MNSTVFFRIPITISLIVAGTLTFDVGSIPRKPVLEEFPGSEYAVSLKSKFVTSDNIQFDVLDEFCDYGVFAPYFREYLRLYMTAQKPERKNYHSWQAQQFYDDSLRWATDPLYGWCNRNFKSNGKPYNIYTDGLKIYTTIDSRMQAYLEDAVHEHIVGKLQDKFFKEKMRVVTAPYCGITPDEFNRTMARSMKMTDRYRIMLRNGCSQQEIERAFNTKCKMKVFTYQGMKDTVMTPMDSIRYYKHFLRVGAMSIDPHSGEVKAYVGGTNYHSFKYDMVSTSRRQVGSTITPFLYSLAMEHGFAPCDEVLNVEQTLYDDFGRAWTPRNSSRNKYGEMVSLRWGLLQSNNWISAFLMKQFGPHKLKQLIHRYGLTNQNIEATPSLCLGACDASVLEMVSAYTAFAGEGMRVAPLMVTCIEDNAGNVIMTFKARKNKVISRESSYKMIDMMRGVINEGTGRRIRSLYKITADMCGKTGTTQNLSDGWFIGFTPSLVTGCWVGGEERDIHFERLGDGQGTATALPVYGLYMQKVYADESLPYSEKEMFDIPDGFNPCE